MAEDIIVTGERFIPEAKDEELEIEHLERYECIRELVKGKKVLDAACGEGYGSHLLSQTADSVLGIDIDQKTIEHAKRKYCGSTNLSYEQASVSDMSIVPSNSMDVIVSFETIEHIDEKCQKMFLNEISRILKPDGLLIMSTPDKKEYSDKYSFHNPFHKKEFYVPEFEAFLHQKFKNIKLYNQYLEVAAFIDCPEEDINRIQYVINKERYQAAAKYVIAIAGNMQLPSSSISMAYVHLRREYMPMMEELNYCRKEAIECRKKAERLDESLNEIKLNHEELDRRAIELEKRMELINELRQKNIASEEIAAGQQKELDRRAAELEHRMDEINDRDSKIAVQNNEIKLLNEELDRRAAELEHRMDEINLRDKKLHKQYAKKECLTEELNKANEELDRIRNFKLHELIQWFYSKNRN